MSCPFCESTEVELVSAWGGQLMTSQMRCRACNSHFEAVREDFAAGARRGDLAAGETDEDFAAGERDVAASDDEEAD